MMTSPSYFYLPVFDASEWAFLVDALDLTPPTSNLSSTTIDEPSAVVGQQEHTNKSATVRKPKCEVEGCPNISQTRRRCKRHGGGSRCKRTGCPNASKSRGVCHAHGGGTPCKIPGCDKGRQKRGLCAAHGGLDPCLIHGCPNRARQHGLCRRHSLPPQEAGAFSI